MKTSAPVDGVPLRWSLTAAAVLAIGVLHPVGGTRALCPSRVLIDRPCGLCGITRSVSAACRGDVSLAWGLHPLGVAVVAVATGVLLMNLLPRRLRGRMVAAWRERRTLQLFLGVAIVLALVAYTFVRWSQHTPHAEV